MSAGVTATIALLQGDELHLAHLGETRAYLLRGGSPQQLTRDDTLQNEARAAGFSEEDVARLPDNVVTRALGFGHFAATSGALSLRDGDVVLLTSDGLHGALSDAAITEALLAHPEPGDACPALVAMVESANSSDNITAIAARVEGIATAGARPTS